MPQAIPFIIAAAKAYGAKILTAIIVNVAVGAISRALSSRNTPDPEQAKSQFRQAIPSAQVGFGRCRMTGPNLLFGTFGKFTVDVIAVTNGPIDAFEAFYLNDDKITAASLGAGGEVPTGSDGRYGDNRVRILTRLGAFPETAFAEVVGIVGDQDIWGDDHRGDGVSTLALICGAVKPEDLNKVYPNYEPAVSAVGRWMKAYDWRKDGTLGFSPDGGHRRDDPSTWTWTDNAVVNYVHDEWFNRGQDWNYRFAPTLADLTVAADVCDEAVPLKAGGTEKRYTAHGWYMLNNPPKDLRSRWLETFDGYQVERGDGAFVIKAGKYEAPTITLNEDRILECEWRRSRRSEDNANRLVTAYCSPDHGYTMVEADAWLDVADIDARGFEQSAPFERQWVVRNGQIRRLAKRAMTRVAAVYSGYVVIDLSDDEAELEHRYFRIQNMRGPASMHDVVVEVMGATLDLAKRKVRLDILQADPLIDAWDPATEEGNPPDVAPSAPPAVVPVPDLIGISSFLDDAGQGLQAPRLSVVMTDIDRDDLAYVVSWRIAGEDAFADEAGRSAVDAGTSPPAVMFDSGFVPSVPVLEVRVSAVSSGGRSAWTATVNVDTSTGVGTPTQVTADDLASSPTAAGIGWRNPFGVFAYVKIKRHTSNDPGAATFVSGEIVGGAGQVMTFEDVVGTGTYWWWPVAFDVDDNPGGDPVPATVTVT